MANPMNKFYKACTRRTWVTRCADPTQMVEWTIPATDADGNQLLDRESHAKMVTREFQGVINAWIERPAMPNEQVPQATAQLTHERLEEIWNEEQEDR